MENVNELTVADKLLLYSSKLFPNEYAKSEINKLISEVNDWKNFVDIAIYNGIAPIIYKNFNASINKQKIPESALSRLKQSYYKILHRNILLSSYFKSILIALHENNINVIALKGMLLSEVIYHDLGLRPISDIDILVKKKDVDNARNVLYQIGYTDKKISPSEFIKQTEKHIAPLKKDGVSVEIHLKIHNEQYGYEIDTNDYWENANSVFLHGIDALTLSPNDLLQHLCIHLYSHHVLCNFQLRHYCDIVNVLECFKSKIDWEDFEANCKRNKCLKDVFSILLLAKKFFNALIPDDVIKRNMHFSELKNESIFINALRLNTEEISNQMRNFDTEHNLNNLKRVSGFKNKMKYLIGDIFPSKAFMIQNYNIKNKNMVFVYYIKRLFIGVKKLFKLFSKKLFTKK